MESDDSEAAIKQREVEARDSTAHRDDGSTCGLKNAIEIPPCIESIRSGPLDAVAELGCGTGRLTRLYAGLTKRTVAVDFSLQSLLTLRRTLPRELQARVLTIQADAGARLPLSQGAFSQVCSFQVFEHLPSAESRQTAVRRAAQLLRPGGVMTFTVYNWSKSKQRSAARAPGDNDLKQGFHPSGIYYYNFEEPEVRELVARSGLELEYTQGLIVPIRGGRLLGRLVVPLNRIVASTRFGIRRAHLLLARATARGELADRQAVSAVGPTFASTVNP